MPSSIATPLAVPFCANGTNISAYCLVAACIGSTGSATRVNTPDITSPVLFNLALSIFCNVDCKSPLINAPYADGAMSVAAWMCCNGSRAFDIRGSLVSTTNGEPGSAGSHVNLTLPKSAVVATSTPPLASAESPLSPLPPKPWSNIMLCWPITRPTGALPVG